MISMSAVEAFIHFVNGVLTPARAERYQALAMSAKGRSKIIDGLSSHHFARGVRPDARRDRTLLARVRAQPCYVWSSEYYDHGYIARFESVQSAYEEHADDEDWLIVTEDGAYGVYRPERYDDGLVLAAV